MAANVTPYDIAKVALNRRERVVGMCMANPKSMAHDRNNGLYALYFLGSRTESDVRILETLYGAPVLS